MKLIFAILMLVFSKSFLFSENQEKDLKNFIATLTEHSVYRNIAQIGFLNSHSVEHFFQLNNQLHICSFESGQSIQEADQLSEKYNDNFEYIQGDPSETISQFAKSFPERKFDLIFVQGDPSFNTMFSFLIQCKDISHANTTLWISDYQLKGLQRAVISQQKMGLLEIKNTFRSPNDMQWVEVRYLNF